MNLLKKFTLMLVVVFAMSCFFQGAEVSAKATTKSAGSKTASAKTSSTSTAVKKTTSSTSKSTAAKKTTSSASKKTVSSKSKSKTSASKGTTYKSTTKTATKKPTTTSRGKSSITSRGSGAVVTSGNVEELISYAKKYMGVKYVFGGMSPSGFDCSGFTAFVYKAGGINLPHSATAQSNKGLAVSKNELKPGDLVFFETYKAGISHVGIYVGDGRFIHASSSKGITITSLSESYYAQRYRGATRIIK